MKSTTTSGQLITNYHGDGALLSPDGQYVATQTSTSLPALVQILRVP